jgi:hypothetical protein
MLPTAKDSNENRYSLAKKGTSNFLNTSIPETLLSDLTLTKC